MTDTTAAPGTTAAGVAPADAVSRARWPRWKVLLAYLILAGVALGSVWVIDGHVLSAVDSPTAKTAQ